MSRNFSSFDEVLESKPGDWKVERLGNLFAQRKEKNRPDLPLLAVTGTGGVVPRDSLERRDTSNADKSKYLRVCEGDIAYNTMRMWQGVSGLSSYEGIVSPAYTICRPKDGVSSTYMAQLFKLPELIQIFHRNSQGLVDDTLNLKFENFSPIQIPVPPFPEQQKIAAILSSVDDVIEKTRAQIDKLKDLKTGMMQELLTKGIGHTEFKPLPHWRVGRITDLKSIPANWDLVDILSVAKLESGHTPSRDNEMYWGGDIPWLSLHDTKNLINPIINTTVYSVTQNGIDNSSARILPKNTVALSRTASVGNCVMLGQDMATSQDFANYICGETLHPRYLLQLFRWMQHVWSSLSEGSTHKTIYMPVFKKLQILLPPYAEQVIIADAADKLDATIAAHGEKLAVVINLKKALMQDLLTGKVRVKVDQKESAVA